MANWYTLTRYQRCGILPHHMSLDLCIQCQLLYQEFDCLEFSPKKKKQKNNTKKKNRHISRIHKPYGGHVREALEQMNRAANSRWRAAGRIRLAEAVPVSRTRARAFQVLAIGSGRVGAPSRRFRCATRLHEMIRDVRGHGELEDVLRSGWPRAA